MIEVATVDQQTLLLDAGFSVRWEENGRSSWLLGGNQDPADSWKVHWIDFQVSDGAPGRISVSVRFMESGTLRVGPWENTGICHIGGTYIN